MKKLLIELFETLIKGGFDDFIKLFTYPAINYYRDNESGIWIGTVVLGIILIAIFVFQRIEKSTD